MARRIAAECGHSIILDTGDLVADGSSLSTLKLEPVFLALQAAGHKAICLGEGERLQPPDILRSVATGAGIVPIDRFARFTIQDLGDIRVYACSPSGNPPVLPAENERAGINVLVLPRDVDALARKLAGARGWHIAVATRDPDRTPRYVALGEACIVLSTGRHGQYVADIEVTTKGGRVTRVTPRFVPLDEAIPPSPIGQLILNTYQERLRDERFVERMPRLPLPENRYAGPDACQPCHTAQHTGWKASSHARAFSSLEKDGRVYDPDCVLCHVTGFPITTAYAGKGTADPRVNVGCESCHGPAGRHVENASTKMPGDAKAACATCHTPEHSPHYDPAAYLARIRHW